jgi:hypothetical protein
MVNSSLEQFKDDLNTNLFGITTKQAQEQNVCIECKKSITPASFYSEAGRKEYQISGLCEYCFDKICQEA